MDETVSLKLFHLLVILDRKNPLCLKKQHNDLALEPFQGKRKIAQRLETAHKEELYQVGGPKEKKESLRTPEVAEQIGIGHQDQERVRVGKVIE